MEGAELRRCAMRTLVLAAPVLFALAACGQDTPATQSEPAIEVTEAAPTLTADAESTDESAAAPAPPEPGTCVVYLKMERAAVLAGREKGDAVALETATAAWTKVALQKLNAHELQQFEASSLAVLRETPPDELKSESDRCIAAAPKG
jgi:predicted small lipoprotein YifL